MTFSYELVKKHHKCPGVSKTTAVTVTYGSSNTYTAEAGFSTAAWPVNFKASAAKTCQESRTTTESLTHDGSADAYDLQAIITTHWDDGTETVEKGDIDTFPDEAKQHEVIKMTAEQLGI